MYNLTGIYWIKNESRYLPEYIEFHLLQGFDHFIFYDNNSDDVTLQVLEPYINDGLVEVRYYPPNIDRKNFWLMSTCIDEQKGKSKWIHFHAIDERIFSPTGKKIPEILDEHFDKPMIGGVCVNWQQIHSGGIEKRPDGLIIENYFKGQDIDPSKHIKTIIRPDRTSSIWPPNPHNFHYLPGFISVTENFKHIPDGHPFNHNNEYSFNLLKNLHYVTMSKEEFENKYSKGLLDHAGAEHRPRERFIEDWNNFHNLGDKECLDMIPFIPQVKEAILKRYKDNEEILKYINH